MREQQAAALPAYTGRDLGANWQRDYTLFKLWAPTAAAVRVILYATGSDDEPGAAMLGSAILHPAGQGVWQARVSGNWDGRYYVYALQFEGSDQECLTADPYARACGINGQRSMVIDLDAAAPEGWRQDRRPAIPPHARAVWETHVADFTADPAGGVPEKWRGKYLGFTAPDTCLDGDPSKPTCLNYLKQLGVTHVQLMPIFDFGSTDETDPAGYNWGYDPVNYNVPEGAYSTDPWHGEVRVRECRAMIAAIHRAGLGVVMDVVYNHTYHADSCLERTVPGYYCRRTPDGSLTNGSGCGCDMASERTMMRKYIVDSCLFWAREYHVDGFRFDLMALIDAETMNAVRAALDTLPGGREILMYGEPWTGGGTCMAPGARPADKGALDVLDERIGFFCDGTRDAIKGSVFDAGSKGYVNGGMYYGVRLLHAVDAWRDGADGFRPKASGQVVQYASAHDNYTLWDKLKLAAGRKDFAAVQPDLLAQNRMAAGIYLTCHGLPFLLSGEEFARTKLGAPNSYQGPLSVNRLDWRRAWQLEELVRYYRGLFAIRRAYPELSGAAGETAPILLATPGWMVGFVLEKADGNGELAVLYNPEPTPQQAELPGGSWQYLSDGATAGAVPFGEAKTGQIILAPTSVTILVRR
ncbi:type I pullulanase [uncultured Gemmiger sp.]|uniref:type I pullulanase n=1 Tax=uncultured Gemmiger sp. TaxID=1623490 RepID=UPI0025DB0A90|nr:type I pullulanase [uncultured Gemmiger sp.]